MARVPIIHEDDPTLPEGVKAIIERVKEQNGGLFLNIFRVMLNNPKGLKAFSDFTTSFYREGSVTPREIELAYTTATVVNKCFY
ncbi:MAG: hypothetical protein NVS2B12_35720 [Ktedonobacteraceae bacterium]